MDSVLELWMVLRDLSWNAEAVSALTGSSSAVGSGALTHWWQKRRSRILPTLPSHHEALAKAPDEATRFFSAVHEVTMCVTEAWNAVRSREAGGQVEEVIKRDVLRRNRDRLVSAEEALRRLLYDYATLAAQLPISEFSSLWSYRNRHNYRTETYTVTRTDSKGKTRTETRTRQVYENSDHWFEFDRSKAKALEPRIREWLVHLSRADLPLLNLHTRRVVIGKLDPAQKSFLERLVRHTVLEDAEAEVTDADLAKWANQWLLGTQVDAQLQEFRLNGTNLRSGIDQVFSEMYDSKSHYHFRTRSKTHSGPPGYRAYSRGLWWQRAVSGAWMDVSGMFSACVTNTERLVSLADDPESIEGDREYAELAINAYEAAFPDSKIEVDQLSSTGKTIGLALLGGIAVAALTWALHPMGYAAF